MVRYSTALYVIAHLILTRPYWVCNVPLLVLKVRKQARDSQELAESHIAESDRAIILI